jgi:hypothetical protein
VLSATACNIVLQELSISSNVTGLSTCTGPVSTSQPVVVNLTCTTLDSVNSIQVAVTYQTVQLIPIPGLLAGKTTIYRVAQLPMKTNSSCTTS